MAVSRVVLGNSSKNTKSSDIIVDGTIKISREVYQKLGSLIKNRQLLTEYNDKLLTGSYNEFLEDMNILLLKRNYSNLYPDLVVPEGIEEIDIYLGSLGMTEEYPYSKDIVNISPWISIYTRSDYRYLVDTEGNHLVDGTDNTVLVHYNKEA